MANGFTHAVAGSMAGLGVVAYDRDENGSIQHNPIFAVAVGALFGKMPDILEPALHPHHRQFCHSIVVLLAIGYGVKKAYEWEPKDDLDRTLRLLALGAGTGYISHLVLDGLTPRSLPLVGKI